MTNTGSTTTEARSDAPPSLLVCRGITKSFGAQRALAAVDLEVAAGEVHGLVGENGAGKSTLIRIIGGNETLDAGEVRLAGAPQEIRHPWEALTFGIGIVHQHPALVEGLSIAENIALGTGLVNRRGLVSWRREFSRSAELLEQVGVDRSPAEPASRLSVHERQLVALARALRLGVKLLILDEITAPLTRLEIDRLFELIRRLSAEGAGVVYVSHRLAEIFELTEQVSVMREGQMVTTRPTAEISRDELISLMIGRPSTTLVASTGHALEVGGDPVVQVRNLSGGRVEDISFDVMAGEILGLAGLSGAGRSSILETLFGLHGQADYELRLGGKELSIPGPQEAIGEGIAFVSEDRTVSGYVPEFSVAKTATLPFMKGVGRFGMLVPSTEMRIGRSVIERLGVRPADPRAQMKNLSGGNQQKVILGRWLEAPLKLLLLDEPTHGVDIGAKENIYALLQELSKEGVPIVFASSEFEELEALCSRVLLLHEGQAVGELTGADISTDLILASLLRLYTEGNERDAGDN